MPLYSIEIYHNQEARFMPYEPGQRLTLTVCHTLHLAECAPEYLADWAYEVFNLDLDHLGTARNAPTGETAFLAACVYRLLGYRSLSIGDVVHIESENESRWLACEPAGWRSIEPPAPDTLDGAPLDADKVYRHLQAQRDAR